MKRIIYTVAGISIAAILLFAGYKPLLAAYFNWKTSGPRIASRIERLLHPDTQMILFSLDPWSVEAESVNTKKILHGFHILGEVDVADSATRSKVLSAFVVDVRDAPKRRIQCFVPRHGLRLINKSAVVDFLICFECKKAMAYNLSTVGGFAVSGIAAPELDAVLDLHGIRREVVKE